MGFGTKKHPLGPKKLGPFATSGAWKSKWNGCKVSDSEESALIASFVEAQEKGY